MGGMLSDLSWRHRSTSGIFGSMSTQRLRDLVDHDEGPLLEEWTALQSSAMKTIGDRISPAEVRANSHDFLTGLQQALRASDTEDVMSAAYSDLRDVLSNLSNQWALLGISPADTAAFVFSFKEAVFRRMRQAKLDAAALAEQILVVSKLLDRLGLYTTEVFQKSREGVIMRQQQEMLKLSTPVVELWHGILALPLIGTLDSARTQIVMQNLLEALIAKNADIAIIDITGVPMVDTLSCPAPSENSVRRTLDGRGVHHQRHTPTDRADDYPLGRESGRCNDQSEYGRRVPHRLAETRTGDCQSILLAMEHIPILRLDRFLLVTIQVDMHDRLALVLQEDLTSRIVSDRARGVLIDISALDIVDSFIGRMLSSIAAMARILDAETVVVGMQPSVAITLVELGLSLPGIRTALDVDRGMAMLKTAIAADGEADVGQYS